MIAIKFPTIMDGTVIRWYASESDAKAHNQVISASRNGVYGHGKLTPEYFDAAWAAHARLIAGRSVDEIATHKISLLGGVVTPIEPTAPR